MKKKIASIILLSAGMLLLCASLAWHLTELGDFSADYLPETDALTREKLFNDPLSPQTGAPNPVLKLIVFTRYDCIFCREIETQFDRLLKAYPQIAIRYKIISSGSPSSIKAARMAQSVWIQEPEKFPAFHHALITCKGAPDEKCIQAAIRASGVKTDNISPDSQQILVANRQLYQALSLDGTPSTIINDKVVLGAVTYAELESVVKAALKEA